MGEIQKVIIIAMASHDSLFLFKTITRVRSSQSSCILSTEFRWMERNVE